MKKISILLLVLTSNWLITSLQAQNGLKNIIVERYYVSDVADTALNSDGGTLPVGSVTYRIYADMLPGYKFEGSIWY